MVLAGGIRDDLADQADLFGLGSVEGSACHEQRPGRALLTRCALGAR